MIVLDDDATEECEQIRSVEDRGMVESSPWAMLGNSDCTFSFVAT